MLAELIALAFVSLIVLGPAAYLFNVAWQRGGSARKFAIVVLCLLGVLVLWLMAPTDPALTREEHISDFVGAFGILAAGVGLVVIAAIGFNRLRRWRSKDEKL